MRRKRDSSRWMKAGLVRWPESGGSLMSGESLERCCGNGEESQKRELIFVAMAGVGALARRLNGGEDEVVSLHSFGLSFEGKDEAVAHSRDCGGGDIFAGDVVATI